MLYLRLCLDKPGSAELRSAHRLDHRNYTGSFVGEGGPIRVVQGGPLLAGDADGAILGSFLVVEANSIEDVQRFHDEDPFTVVGLFDRVDIIRWDRHIGGGVAYVPGSPKVS